MNVTQNLVTHRRVLKLISDTILPTIGNANNEACWSTEIIGKKIHFFSYKKLLFMKWYSYSPSVHKNVFSKLFLKTFSIYFEYVLDSHIKYLSFFSFVDCPEVLSVVFFHLVISLFHDLHFVRVLTMWFVCG